MNNLLCGGRDGRRIYFFIILYYNIYVNEREDLKMFKSDREKYNELMGAYLLTAEHVEEIQKRLDDVRQAITLVELNSDELNEAYEDLQHQYKETCAELDNQIDRVQELENENEALRQEIENLRMSQEDWFD
jgi:chromosome segregation ATPase